MVKSDTIRVLLADDNVDFCNVLVKYLQQQDDIEVVGVSHDGNSAYEKIKLHMPDVVILDGVMPGLDGLGVLEKLSADASRPVCIMLSNLRHENVTQYAHILGAEYYITKPFEMGTLASRIRLFKKDSLHSSFLPNGNIKDSSKMITSIDLEKRISDIFHEIGIPAHIRGYNYLRTAIVMIVHNPEILYYITKELYPAVAKKCNTEVSTVERAIRNAIDIVWSRGGKKATERVLGQAFSKDGSRPTNSEFIAYIADMLRLEMPAI